MCASRIATPAKSFADDAFAASTVLSAGAVRPALSRGAQATLLLLNVVPLLHATSVVLALLLSPWSWFARIALAATALWLVPPLVCRTLFACRPLEDGVHALGSRGFWTWWTSLKLQTLYLRLPFTEEVLRLVPGLYSAWLRLWGARIGRLTYWSPGVEITDRSLIDVGDQVVVGGKARLGAHLFRREADGRLELLVGRIRLGDRCMVGAQSALGPGVRLDDDEFTHAFFLGRPFTRWRQGKRVHEPCPVSAPSPHEN